MFVCGGKKRAHNLWTKHKNKFCFQEPIVPTTRGEREHLQIQKLHRKWNAIKFIALHYGNRNSFSVFFFSLFLLCLYFASAVCFAKHSPKMRVYGARRTFNNAIVIMGMNVGNGFSMFFVHARRTHRMEKSIERTKEKILCGCVL